MKTFEFTTATGILRMNAASFSEAKTALGITTADLKTWRIVPTARQIKKTKSLLRGI